MTTLIDDVIAVQATPLPGLRLQAQDAQAFALLDRYWPPVSPCDGLSGALRAFLATDAAARRSLLAALRTDPARHGAFVHLALGEIYSYLFGYQDGVATGCADDDLEAGLLGMKILLEREFLDHWMGAVSHPHCADQGAAAAYLGALAATNPGVRHPLFSYLEHDAPREHVVAFLRGEVIRNEVVDDEVALLAFGLQGSQKAVAVANLWDECGRGKLENFHTFWLRRFIGAGEGGWDAFLAQRGDNPWFARITSNTNNMLLTRPAYKQLAYGCFLVFESWVEPHFRALLGAMDRLGIADPDQRIYFDAHVAVDPRHARELADGIRLQTPPLSARHVDDLVRGAHLAIDAGCRQYDYWLAHFTAPHGAPRSVATSKAIA